MIKMTVDEILNAELTEEEVDKLVYELTKRKDNIFKEKRKQALIAFEKAYSKLMEISPSETIDIEFVNDGVTEIMVDILDVLENYFKNSSTEYHID